MTLRRRSLRVRPRVLFFFAFVFAVVVCSLLAGGPGATRSARRPIDEEELRQRFPLAWKHVHTSKGVGGAWYIPPEWDAEGLSQPRNIIEAVRLAANATQAHPERHIPFSNIPLFVHQTWKSVRLDGVNAKVLPYVERWLEYSVSPPRGAEPMAYFFWDDEGVMALAKELEGDFVDDFVSVFSSVEKSDIFRVAVCKWFGGIYADMDTNPLQHPTAWIHPSDLAAWTDNATGGTFGLDEAASARLSDPASPRPVNLAWGIEADTDPDTDAHWLMGYTYPVQLTNWALASAPQHPVLSQFMDGLVDKAAEAKDAALRTASGTGVGIHSDPITRTGPAAVTEETSKWLKEHARLRWNALTGLKDGGKAKLVADVLILPITGFSPARNKHSRMGEKPLNHPDARLAHLFMGSWRHTNIIVEYGKFCRTVFKLCRDWPQEW